MQPVAVRTIPTSPLAGAGAFGADREDGRAPTAVITRHSAPLRTSPWVPVGAALLIVVFQSGCGSSMQLHRHDVEGPWNGYRATFTFSTDDNQRDNLVWADLFEDHGLRFTLFVVPSILDQPGRLTSSDLQRLHDRGFEIAAHGMHHLRLPDLTYPEKYYEMAACRETLKQMVDRGDYECRTFAYPYSAHGPPEVALAEQLFLAARNGPWRGEHRTSDGRIPTWGSVSLHNVSSHVTMRDLTNRNTYTEAETRDVIRRYIRQWEDENVWSNVYAHELSECDADHMGWIIDELQRASDIWIAPFGEVAAYIAGRRPASVQAPLASVENASQR